MEDIKKEFWKETSKLIDAHRKDGDERAAQGVVDCRILFNRLVKNLTIPDVSGSFSEFVTWARQADLWEGHEMDSLADNFREFNEDNKR